MVFYRRLVSVKKPNVNSFSPVDHDSCKGMYLSNMENKSFIHSIPI